MLKISIKSLLAKPTGGTEKYEINESAKCLEDEEIHYISPIKGTLILRNLPDKDISLEIQDFSLEIEATCSRCLKKFTEKIEIQSASTIYYWSKPEDSKESDEIVYIDQRKFEIDVADFIRQEILLHFSLVPVCLESCKGLCLSCGKDLNLGTCDCDRSQSYDKPLSRLKDILKKSKNGKARGSKEKNSKS